MEDHVFLCRKLIEMLDQDVRQLSLVFEGELFDSYQKWIDQEKRSLKTIQNTLKQV